MCSSANVIRYSTLIKGAPSGDDVIMTSFSPSFGDPLLAERIFKFLNSESQFGFYFLLDQYYTGIRWTKPLSSRHSDEWRHSRVSDGFKFIEENHSGLWSYKTSVSQTIINVINDVIAYIVTCLDSYVTAYVTIKTKGGAKTIKIDFKIPRGDYFKRRTR